MKRLLVVAIACIVVDQMKIRHGGWLTTCKGPEENAQIVIDAKVVRGQQVNYKPFIVDGDEFSHGTIIDITDAPKEVARDTTESETGKLP